jgi:acetyltransferase-like isoleucine patch superfamily enzyme
MPSGLSESFSHEEWSRYNEETIALLKERGAVVPNTFKSTGKPQLCFWSFCDDVVNPADFHGRLVFKEGAMLDNSPYSPFPHGPCRLTLIKLASGKVGSIEVGENTTLNGTSIVSYESVKIGANVLFGPQTVIMDCDGHPSDRRLPDNAETKASAVAPVVIEDHAWIGYGALIMKGVTIGHHAVVAANAVVVKDVPPHGVVGGNPAKLLKVYE